MGYDGGLLRVLRRVPFLKHALPNPNQIDFSTPIDDRTALAMVRDCGSFVRARLDGWTKDD